MAGAAWFFGSPQMARFRTPEYSPQLGAPVRQHLAPSLKEKTVGA